MNDINAARSVEKWSGSKQVDHLPKKKKQVDLGVYMCTELYEAPYEIYSGIGMMNAWDITVRYNWRENFQSETFPNIHLISRRSRGDVHDLHLETPASAGSRCRKRGNVFQRAPIELLRLIMDSFGGGIKSPLQRWEVKQHIWLLWELIGLSHTVMGPHRP